MPLRSRGAALRLGDRDRAADRDGRSLGELVAARRAALLRRARPAAATCSTAAGRSRGATTTEPLRPASLRVAGYALRIQAGSAHRPAGPAPAPDGSTSHHAPTRPHQTRATACGRVRVPRAGRRGAGGTAAQRRADGAAGRRRLGWTSLSASQDVVVHGHRLGRGDDRARGRRSAAVVHRARSGFRSMWYSISVPEAAVLRVTVVSTDPARYQPVVSVLDPGARRGRLRARERRQGGRHGQCDGVRHAQRTTARPRPISCASPRWRNNSPSGGLPTLTVRFAARDVTPPHIRVHAPVGRRRTRRADDLRRRSDCDATDDASRRRIRRRAHWEFHDKLPRQARRRHARDGLRVDVHVASRRARTTVVFSVVGPRRQPEHVPLHDARAGHDRGRTSTFSLRPPAPGAHRLQHHRARPPSRCTSACSSRRSGARAPLLRRFVSFWGDRARTRARCRSAASSARACRGRQRRRARSRRQRDGAAAVRGRSRDRAGQLHLTVTLSARSVTDP